MLCNCFFLQHAKRPCNDRFSVAVNIGFIYSCPGGRSDSANSTAHAGARIQSACICRACTRHTRCSLCKRKVGLRTGRRVGCHTFLELSASRKYQQRVHRRAAICIVSSPCNKLPCIETARSRLARNAKLLPTATVRVSCLGISGDGDGEYRWSQRIGDRNIPSAQSKGMACFSGRAWRDQDSD